MSSYHFAVKGLPKPKGSMRAFSVRGRAVVASDRSAADWQKVAAFQLQDFPGPIIEGPVEVRLAFFLPRPQSLPKRVQQHTRKPDIDKLARAVLDAMTGIVFRDDAQVTFLEAVKGYATVEELIGLQGLVNWEG